MKEDKDFSCVLRPGSEYKRLENLRRTRGLADWYFRQVEPKLRADRNSGKTISIGPTEYADLLKLYNQGHEIITYKGNEYVRSYLYYLLSYVQKRLGIAGEVNRP